MFRLSGTKLRLSITYHPETDGQTEVLNRILEQYLRSFVHGRPTLWSTFLTLTEWSYNTFIHSSTELFPFEITYGKPPPLIPQYLQGSSSVEVAYSIMTTCQALHAQLQHRLQKAQAIMKHFTDHN